MSQAIHACHFLKNFVARACQGCVGQSSPNVAYIIEKPSVLNKLFFRITIFCRVRAWEQKVCGRGLKICQISSLFGPPCSLSLRHLWPSPPAIGWPWSSRFPTCETCFVRRTFICVRRPLELEFTSCLGLRDSSLSLSSFKHHLKIFIFSFC